MEDFAHALNCVLENEKIQVRAPVKEEFAGILTPEVLRFVARLERAFRQYRLFALDLRALTQRQINSGKLPDFFVREDVAQSDWRVQPIPADLQKRWVEITGPASNRKMVINALNSGADVYMADAEDSESPTWNNILQGQANLYGAVRGSINYYTTEKVYRLNEKAATLMFRPRGWHLLEKHVYIDHQPVSASLFDFGVYFFNNAAALLEKGSGPYFYLPKLEQDLEAWIWNKIFEFAQDELKIPRGSIKATVLIETITAAFCMEMILYELREHSVGLNCGRWDYIFSFIKKFHNYPQFVLPDRSEVTMDKDFLASYVNLLIQICHKRGAYAMGGMAAQIPIKNNPAANEKALEKVRADKLREVQAGHDGTWVAHPGLVPVAREIFENHMPGPNQLKVLREDVKVTAGDLLKVPGGGITEIGLRTNIRVGVEYLDIWLKGNGAVAINNLMEDAATAEISRSQVWQWLKHRKISLEQIDKAMLEETDGRSEAAKNLFYKMITADEFPEFLTIPAYEELLKIESQT